MIIPARKEMYPEIMQVWEASVRATHHFIPEAYLQEIKRLLPGMLPSVNLLVDQNSDGQMTGFAGVDGDKLEMLFVRPELRGKGIGSRLLQYTIQQLGIKEVTVNKQNTDAVAFYKKMGFIVTATQALDGMGRPYPLLIMKLP